MSEKPRVSARQVWKRFRLDEPGGGLPWRRPPKDHWALRDVNFTLADGGALGLIGANGSGKSTLLKLLAGVIQPTSGSVETQGRVIAVLNPTAGFHPDLSGLDNVRMLSTLQGFERAEIEERLPLITEFSGLGDYVRQPLKSFSAGMMIRLGVSTAMHLDPDVLIVDEVLSAGDLAFQRKAVARARALRDEGCAVIVSTHALGDLATLCDRLLLLEQGAVRSEGSADTVVASYMQSVEEQGGRIQAGAPLVGGARPTTPDGRIRITHLKIAGSTDPDMVTVQSGQPFELEIGWETTEPVDDAVFRFQLFRNDGLFAHGQNTARHGLELGRLEGRGVARLRYEQLGLLAGDYYVALGIWPDEYRSLSTGEPYDHRPSAAVLRVTAERSAGAGIAGFPCEWTVEAHPSLNAVEPSLGDDADGARASVEKDIG